jgi:hypothetical protein
MFRAESLEALARSRRPRVRDRSVDSHNGATEHSLQQHNDTVPADDPDDRVDPDDCGPRLSVTLKEQQTVEKIYILPALPPPSPDWSHLLCGRPHESASTLSARMALLAVGCRLSIHPSLDALCEAARCHTAGMVRRLLVQIYGERGLAIAYQLAGREQPLKTAAKTNVLPKGDAAPLSCDAIEPGLASAIMQAPTRVQRWMLAPPYDPPRWRYRETGAEREAREQCESDGAWCG